MPQKEPESSVEMIMNERIRHYVRVKGTSKMACYDKEDRLLGYYDTETGKVYDADEKYVGLGFHLLATLKPKA